MIIMSDKIEPYYGNKIIIVILIIIELVFYGLILISSFSNETIYSCLSLKIPKDENLIQKIVFLCEQVSPVFLIFFIFINIIIFLSIIALFILFFKDDCNIRFAKLKELNEIRTKVETFAKDENTENNINEESKHTLCNHKNTSKTNRTNIYDFYKKYMDTIAEI